MKQQSLFLTFGAAFLTTTLGVAQWSTGGGNPNGNPGNVVQGGFPIVNPPAGNPITQPKALLGKTLFWDEQLSSNRTVACGTCHEPRFGMSDGRAAHLGQASVNPGPDAQFGTPDDKVASRGPTRLDSSGRYVPDTTFGLNPRVGTRRAPTTINSAFLTNLFWDGRVETGEFRDPITNQVVLPTGAAIENVIKEPFVNDMEMAHEGRTWQDVVARINSSEPLALSPRLSPDLTNFTRNQSYASLFSQAFGSSQVTASRTIMAIATYLRTLVSDQSKFDDFVAGNPAALSPQEIHGFSLFQANACTQCHLVGIFTDNQFHNTGIRPVNEDPGRGSIAQVPGANAAGEFRTPSLRNVALRAPFFHNGSAQTLGDVIDFYARGGDFPPAVNPLTPFTMTTADRDAMVAFLNALTDPRVAQETTPFDRPVLASTFEPTRFGGASIGAGGHTPAMVAFEAAATGNPAFTVAMQGGTAGAQAYLLMSPTSLSNVSILGVDVLVDLSHPASGVLPIGALNGQGAGGGYGQASFEIPNHSALVGVDYNFQWMVIDPGAPYGLAASEAARARIF